MGGGESTFEDDLIARGYGRVTVLDVSQAAIDATRARLGAIWYDRAVFHFLTAAEDRAEYVARVRQPLKRGGHLIVATFGPGGPLKCSGLEVCRYDAASLQRELGRGFGLSRASPSFMKRHSE